MTSDDAMKGKLCCIIFICRSRSSCSIVNVKDPGLDRFQVPERFRVTGRPPSHRDQSDHTYDASVNS